MKDCIILLGIVSADEPQFVVIDVFGDRKRTVVEVLPDCFNAYKYNTENSEAQIEYFIEKYNIEMSYILRDVDLRKLPVFDEDLNCINYKETVYSIVCIDKTGADNKYILSGTDDSELIVSLSQLREMQSKVVNYNAVGVMNKALYLYPELDDFIEYGKEVNAKCDLLLQKAAAFSTQISVDYAVSTIKKLVGDKGTQYELFLCADTKDKNIVEMAVMPKKYIKPKYDFNNYAKYPLQRRLYE